MAKSKSEEEVKDARAKRNAESQKALKRQNEGATSARDVLKAHRGEVKQKELEDQIAKAEAESEAKEKTKKSEKVHLLDSTKVASGAGLKPGDLFAPKSNPGAAARVPSQPLQPESMQSHGKGILFDKDLDNPPYNEGDPEYVDQGPSGSGSPTNDIFSRGVDKEAEQRKAESLSSEGRQYDPDNTTVAAGGKKDPTASPHPIGTGAGSKTNTPGGSNSGS